MLAKVCSSFSGQFPHTVLQCFAWPVMFDYTALANRTGAGAQNSLKPKQHYSGPQLNLAISTSASQVCL